MTKIAGLLLGARVGNAVTNNNLDNLATVMFGHFSTGSDCDLPMPYYVQQSLTKIQQQKLHDIL